MVAARAAVYGRQAYAPHRSAPLPIRTSRRRWPTSWATTAN